MLDLKKYEQKNQGEQYVYGALIVYYSKLSTETVVIGVKDMTLKLILLVVKFAKFLKQDLSRPLNYAKFESCTVFDFLITLRNRFCDGNPNVDEVLCVCLALKTRCSNVSEVYNITHILLHCIELNVRRGYDTSDRRIRQIEDCKNLIARCEAELRTIVSGGPRGTSKQSEE